MMAEIHIAIITSKITSVSALKVEFYIHLENPAIAAQTDPVHGVVRVGDCKHLEEEKVVDVVEE